MVFARRGSSTAPPGTTRLKPVQDGVRPWKMCVSTPRSEGAAALSYAYETLRSMICLGETPSASEAINR